MDNSTYLKEMGVKVKAAHNERKITLTVLSSDTASSITALPFLENGKSNPHLLTFKAIADVFKMDVKDFIA